MFNDTGKKSTIDDAMKSLNIIQLIIP